ncbi:MAG TPA: hypothetical protein VJ476_09720 [Rhizomicrobium sp.]|nr:hypothetical protein [Rhizomicrobium sp.]
MVALVIRPYATAAFMPHRYQQQDSPQTLAEGLEEYYRANAGIVSRPAALPPASAALFRSHDICHVIFGLDTTLADETLADTRTLFSCDVGWKTYTGYINDPLAKAVFAELGVWRTIAVTLRSIPRIVRAWRERKRMTKKWPWVPPESFQVRTLADLRREFGIRVM